MHGNDLQSLLQSLHNQYGVFPTTYELITQLLPNHPTPFGPIQAILKVKIILDKRFTTYEQHAI